MGANQSSSSRPCSIPNRPFDKRGNYRTCLVAASVLSRPVKKARHLHISVLAQLILLQDWQRVLIRVTLFPKEISKPCIVKLYGIRWKVLPLHLACALQPPLKVVAALLFEQGASIPVECLRKWEWKHQWQKWKWQRPISEDRDELLTTHNDDDELSLVESEPSNQIEWKCISQLVESNSLILVSTDEKSAQRDVPESSCATYIFDDGMNDDSATCTGSVSVDASKELSDVVLQLTELGGIVHMPLTTIESHDTASTSHGDEESSFSRMPLKLMPQDALLQSVADAACLLPIHVACLYQASPLVLEMLLEAHPMGGLSSVMGMLPIHWIASGWTVEPLHPPLQLLSQFELATQNDSNDACHSIQVRSLQVLARAIPESVHAKSALHGMTPAEYIENNLEENSTQDECLEALVLMHSVSE